MLVGSVTGKLVEVQRIEPRAVTANSNEDIILLVHEASEVRLVTLAGVPLRTLMFTPLDSGVLLVGSVTGTLVEVQRIEPGAVTVDSNEDMILLVHCVSEVEVVTSTGEPFRTQILPFHHLIAVFCL